MKRSRAIGAFAAVLAVAALRFVTTAPGNIDDAFILLVYVKHLLAGGGLSWNLADGRLDGFTSPLDLLVKSGAVALWPRDPVLAAWAVTLACHLAAAAIALALGIALARAANHARPIAAGALLGLVVASSPAMADGSAFLLETPLACALALAGVALWLRPPTGLAPLAGAGVLLAALPLARPEALPLALALTALVVARSGSRAPLIALPLLAAYALWHRRYFGAWLPNTYYAKTSDSRVNELRDGVAYVAAYALSPGLPMLAAALAAPFLARRRRDGALAIALLVWLSLAAVVWAGGDSYGGGRFLAIPLVLAPVALLVLALDGNRLARGAMIATLAVQLAAMVAVPAYLAIAERPMLLRWLREDVPVRASSFDCHRRAAERLAALFADGVVAQTDDQRLKFFADALYVRDLTGLNDRAIAHGPAPGPVRWGKLDLLRAIADRPHAIVLGHRTEPNALALADHPLAESFRRAELHDALFGYGVGPDIAAAFVAAYRPASLAVCGGWFNFLVRADLAPAASDLRLGTAR